MAKKGFLGLGKDQEEQEGIETDEEVNPETVDQEEQEKSQEEPAIEQPSKIEKSKPGIFRFVDRDGLSYKSSMILEDGKEHSFESKKGIIETSDAMLANHLTRTFAPPLKKPKKKPLGA